MVNHSMRRKPPTELYAERALSEAAFRPIADSPAAAAVRPSTPHNPYTAFTHGRQRGIYEKSQLSHDVLQLLNVKGLEPQLSSTAMRVHNGERMTKTHTMRGVITGPARWRSSSYSYGTPSLYCAVYNYRISPGDASSDTHLLSSPKRVSSTWGRGPLVIEGVPVPERRPDVQEDSVLLQRSTGKEELNSVHVLAVGLFRNSSGSTFSAVSFCEGSGHLGKTSAPLPRPDDLLGVLHIPLHCVHLAEFQQEVKLRLPVGSPPTHAKDPFEGTVVPEGDKEGEIAALLSPACSLERLEAVFRNGLTANTTGINRCNVMLFRLSDSNGSFLSTSAALFQAALIAPLTPSVASTARQLASNAGQHHSPETAKPQQQQPSTSSLMDPGISGVAPAAGIRARAPDKVQLPDKLGHGVRGFGSSDDHDDALICSCPPEAENGELSEARMPSPSCTRSSQIVLTASGSSPQLSMKDQKRQRQQQRQQELSVAAVLAASAITAAARGERERSSRTSASRQLSASQRLVAALKVKGTQRPSSVHSLIALNTGTQHRNGSSFSMQSQLLDYQRTTGLKPQWKFSGGAESGNQGSETTGETDLSPDDSVSVRGDNLRCAVTAVASHVAGTVKCLSSSSLKDRLFPRECDDMRFDSRADDRKSTLSTSIRRLDCLMTRAQLFLSQRRQHQQPHEGQQLINSNLHGGHDKHTDQRESPSAPGLCQQPDSQKQQNSDDAQHQRPPSAHSSEVEPALSTKVQEAPLAVPLIPSGISPQSENVSPGHSSQASHAPHEISKCFFLTKAVKWVLGASRRREDFLTQTLVFKAWMQEARLRRQHRHIVVMRIAAASAAACRGTLERQQLQLGWVALEAHVLQRRCQTLEDARADQEAEMRSRTTGYAMKANPTEQVASMGDERGERSHQEEGKRSNEAKQQVQQPTQLPEGLQQHQFQAGEKCCQHLDKHSSEHQHSDTEELSTLRRQVAQLEEQLKLKGHRGVGLPVSSAVSLVDDGEKQGLLQQLEKNSLEIRQLQLLVMEHAAAKASSEEEQRRMQNELIANQKRTEDLEQQLLLVDEQLVGILKHAVPTTTPSTHQRSTESTQLASLGSWAVQQLQGMRDTLKCVQEKKPMGPSTEARRQPPVEIAPLAPLQQLSRDPSVQTDHTTQGVKWTKQQGSTLTRGPQVATQKHQQPAEETAPIQLHHAKVKQGPSLPQTARFPTSGRPEASFGGCVRTPQHAGAGQRADVFKVASGSRLSETPEELQHSQRLLMPQGMTVLRSHHVREQLDRQRTHRQQLLDRSVHTQQQMLIQQPMHAVLSSHSQTSFTSMHGYPQVSTQNYEAYSMPLHWQQSVCQQGFRMFPHMRAASPQCNLRASPSRQQAR